VGVAQTSAGQSLLRRAGLTSKPPAYTELAFSLPEELPEKLPPARVPIHAPFVIHNVADSSRTYSWTFRELQGTRAKVLSTGRLSVAAGGRARANPQLQVTCHGQRERIELRLSQPAQSIGWWATCTKGVG
jgi:hypothetical protein